MKKHFTILACALCMVFTGFAQVQIGNSIDGTAPNGEFGRTADISGSGTQVVTNEEDVLDNFSHYTYNATTEQWDNNSTSLGGATVGEISRLSTDGMRVVSIKTSIGIAISQYNSGSDTWELLDEDFSAYVDFLDVDINSDGTRIIGGTATATHIYNIVAGMIVEMPGSPIAQRADFVSISDDGSRIATSNMVTGISKSYEYNSATMVWDLKATTVANELGGDIAISGDGTRVAVYATSYFDVAVLQFADFAGSGLFGTFIPMGSNEGAAIDISADGNRIVLGAKGTTKATKVYDYNGSSWVQVNETVEFSGGEVGISSDGSRIVMGDPTFGSNLGQVRIYDFDMVPPAIEPGDDCAEANSINPLFGQAVGAAQTSSTYNLTNYTPEAMPVVPVCFEDAGISNSIWYSFTGDGNTYNITTVQCDSPTPNFDSQIVIYSGNCTTPMEVACDEDEDSGAGLYNANLDLETEDGTTYLMLIDVYSGQALIDFCVQVTQLEVVVAPEPGDDCAEANNIDPLFGQAVNVAQTSSTYNLTNYTAEAMPVVPACFEDAAISNSVWYSFTGDGNTYNITTVQCGGPTPNFDSQIVIYSGNCTTPVEVACDEDEDYGAGLFNANLDLETEDGTTYLMLIDVYSGQPLIDFCVQVTQLEVVVAPEPGDDCAEANNIDPLFGQAVNVAQTSSTYNLTNYTAEAMPVVPACFEDAAISNSVWYSFTGDGNTYNITTVQCGGPTPNFDSQIVIYSGNCTTPVEVACDEDEDYGAGLYNANLDLETEDGTTYLMLIDAFTGSALIDFCLQVTQLEPNAVTDINKTDIQVFPNPTTGVLQLQNVDADRVDVLDNLGRIVFSQNRPGNQIDIAELSAGFYFLKISVGADVFTGRVVKE